MSEAPVDIPTSWWERVRADRRKLAAVLGAGVLALVLIGLLVAGAFGGGSGDSRDIADLDLPPVDAGSDEATASPDATGTAAPPLENSDVVEPGEEQVPGSDVSGEGDGPPARAPYIAYRLSGVIVVSRDDGTAPVEVVVSDAGAFALSPDGAQLALVEGGELRIVTVADGSARKVGPAEALGLAWGADSSVVYVARLSGPGASSEVWRVPVSGGEPSKVVAGGPAAVASDGTVAVPADPGTLAGGARGALWVLRPGSGAREVPAPGQVLECAVETGLIVFAVHGSTEPEIRTVRYDGGGDRRLIGPPASPRPFGFGSLILSPDGSSLLYAEVGDDGYSRAFVVQTEGAGSGTPLTVRRDTYPFGWSADGSRVLFVEGNAFQGEPTTLLAARPDGTGRSVLVEGAGF